MVSTVVRDVGGESDVGGEGCVLRLDGNSGRQCARDDDSTA